VPAAFVAPKLPAQIVYRQYDLVPLTVRAYIDVSQPRPQTGLTL
jgi:hypothetical protein